MDPGEDKLSKGVWVKVDEDLEMIEATFCAPVPATVVVKTEAADDAEIRDPGVAEPVGVTDIIQMLLIAPT